MATTANLDKALETRKLFDDAIALKEPKRVPIFGNLFTWAIANSRYKISEAERDYDKLYEAYYRVAKECRHDSLFDVGVRNPVLVWDALGVRDYQIDDQTGYINHVEHPAIAEDEYDEFIAAPHAFLTEKVAPRRMDALKGSKQAGKEAIKQGAAAFFGYFAHAAKLQAAIAQDFGELLAGAYTLSPMENMVTNLRGLKGAIKDMRRHPDQLEQALEALYPYSVDEYVLATASPPVVPPSFDVVQALIMPFLLNREHFGRFYWPWVKRLSDTVVADGRTQMFFTEGNCAHLYGFFKELPPGKVAIEFENDDLVRAKKELGDTCCIIGGISNRLLYYGSKQECIEETKRLLDALAPGGGYIFANTTMMSDATDGKWENVAAVNEYVREHGVY